MRKGEHHTEASKEKNRLSCLKSGRIPWNKIRDVNYKDKVCKKCKIRKGISEFYKNKTTSDGLTYSCKACLSIEREPYRKIYYQKNKEKLIKISKDWGTSHKDRRMNSNLKRYGITVEQYNQMFVDQDGKCSICNNTNTVGKNLGVDHNHETGKVRGLLCHKCNIGLGHFDDNIGKLLKAINYLNLYGN
jgi:hypothetical protein